jgi:GH25 family lysozyme M1 (1,4-beta-N-acetylmuramidase)
MIDVSENQGPDVDFSQAHAEDYHGAIVKMTEGVGYVDPQGVRNLRRARAEMDVVGCYHFLWGGYSPVRQANHFLEQISEVVNPGRVLLFVDVEISNNMSPAQHPTFDDVSLFLHTLEDAIPGKKLCIYSGYYWRENMSNPDISGLELQRNPIIWDAHYFSIGADYGSVLYEQVPDSYWENPAYGGERADILQFADTGRLRQFPKGIDVNATRGTMEDLKQWAAAP